MTDPYRPLNSRKLVLVTVLSLLTSGTVILSMIYEPGRAPIAPRAPAPDAPRCVAGQTTGCVGGTATVIAVPASAAPAQAP